MGVVVVSSELAELLGLCTRILVMREGELVAEVAGEEATELELLRHAVAPTDTEPVMAGRRSDEHHRRTPEKGRSLPLP